MNKIKTNIIPKKATVIDLGGVSELDLKAICAFVAIGFFLDTDTYWTHKKVLKPACIHSFDADNMLIESKPWFKWHHTPRSINFEQALDEFESLFEKIITEQTSGKRVILPLSGGLDSRTQAVALRDHDQVNSCSYHFLNGYPEHKIAQKIADKSGFHFNSFEVQKGYLWDCIEDLAMINKCYSDFTHPRQMAFVNAYKNMGDVFSLGHWGDVLFDNMNLPQLSENEEVEIILKKITKSGGLELAASLWESWGLPGTFDLYLKERIQNMLERIQIDNSNAKIRAFKSLYWAPRWTSSNLTVFETAAPVELPFYDDRMCEFICTLPEEYLKGRLLQIEYVKRRSDVLANIKWQEHRPFNLNTYHLNKMPYNLPYRIFGKINREIHEMLGKPYISRNWELQFLGKENEEPLKKWLFESDLSSIIPKELIQQYYNKFKEKNNVKYAHSVSMLLTLALFSEKFYKKQRP